MSGRRRVGALAVVLSAVFGIGGFFVWDFLLPGCRIYTDLGLQRFEIRASCWPYTDIGLIMIAIAGALLILGLVMVGFTRTR